MWLANQREDDLAFSGKMLGSSEASAKMASFNRYS